MGENYVAMDEQDQARGRSSTAALKRLYVVATEQLKNNMSLMSNPPQSSAAWDIRNAIQREIDGAAETADEIERLRDVLQDWLNFAEEELGEFDVAGDECPTQEDDCDCKTLCPQCQSSGCIQSKIRRTRALLASPDKETADGGERG